MEQRKDKRFDIRLYVKLKSGSKSSWGLLSDVSKNGLFVKSTQNFSKDAVIDIELFMPDNSVSILKGVVRRNVELPETHRKFGMGIEIIQKNEVYTKFLRSLGEQIKVPLQTLS